MSDKHKEGELERSIEYLRGELRTGGGATLDELFDLALAVQAELADLKGRLDKMEHSPDCPCLRPKH